MLCLTLEVLAGRVDVSGPVTVESYDALTVPLQTRLVGLVRSLDDPSLLPIALEELAASVQSQLLMKAS
jgi:hypothetical protein